MLQNGVVARDAQAVAAFDAALQIRQRMEAGERREDVRDPVLEVTKTKIYWEMVFRNITCIFAEYSICQ
jgi:hypothetical protein